MVYITLPMTVNQENWSINRSINNQISSGLYSSRRTKCYVL